MSTVLFLNQPTTGHLNVLLTIALQMRDDDHKVQFLIPGKKIALDPPFQVLKDAMSLSKTIERHGISVDVILPPITTLIKAIRVPYTSGYNEFSLVVGLSSIGAAYYTKRILKFLTSIQPDVLVSDFAFFPAYFAAELADIPCAVIYHSGLPFKGSLIPPFASGLPIGAVQDELHRQYEQREHAILKRLDDRLNRARQKFGLPPNPPDILRRPYSKWLNLVVSTQAIEAPRDNLTANTLYIGPCFAKRMNLPDIDFPFENLKNDLFKVYVSLGTVFNNKPQVFRKIMHALDHPDYQVIISAGGAYKRLIKYQIPDNVMLFPSVPQVDLLPHIDLVIGHGGNNSTNETLSAGKPLIVMPIGGEQMDNASRVEYLKVGLRLNIKDFTAQELRQKVDQIKNNPGFQQRASLLKEAIAQTDGCSTSSACIQWLTRHRRPLNRPEGFPITITKDNLHDLLSVVPGQE
jgi:MGT family glycosyltransferase